MLFRGFGISAESLPDQSETARKNSGLEAVSLEDARFCSVSASPSSASLSAGGGAIAATPVAPKGEKVSASEDQVAAMRTAATATDEAR